MCLRCMRKIGNNTTCPYCNSESDAPQGTPMLPLKTVVASRYLIGKVIGSNSEGFTYNAFDLKEKKSVTLRELFPEGMLTRGEDNYCLVNVGKAADFIDTKDAFIILWKKVSAISGYTALGGVLDVFEDLGTVYAVTEFLGEGKTLREHLLSNEQGFISWDEARVLLMPVVSAMGELQAAGIIDGEISPETLFVDIKGKVKITGFSIADIRKEKTIFKAELFEGYAAVEQYGMSKGLSPATDIYGFAAVLFRALTGTTPMSAPSRLTNDKMMIPGKFMEQLPAYVINALINALQVLPEERTSSVEVLRNELSASPAAAGSAAEAYATIYEEEYSGESDFEDCEEADEVQAPQESPKKLKKSTIAVFVVSVVLGIAILCATLFAIKGLTNNSDNEPSESAPELTDDIDNNHGTNPGDVISISLPNFKGQVYDEIKNDETYKYVLIFKTVYIDSQEERGTVVSQSRTPGSQATSISPMEITLEISNGLEVPDVVGMDIKSAIDQLKNTGFKNIKSESASVAGSAADSNKVYSIVYEDPKTGEWAEIPSDKRLSSGDVISLYYYGEFTETTEATALIIDINPPVEDSTEEQSDNVPADVTVGDADEQGDSTQ